MIRSFLRGGRNMCPLRFSHSQAQLQKVHYLKDSTFLIHRTISWLLIKRPYSVSDNADYLEKELDEMKSPNTNEDSEKEKRKVEELCEIQKQLDEMDKKFDSYFTVEYVLGYANRGFKDTDDDEPDASSDTEISGSQSHAVPDDTFKGSSEDELSDEAVDDTPNGPRDLSNKKKIEEDDDDYDD